jgi:peptide subunit release factor 1 (eRF1)
LFGFEREVHVSEDGNEEVVEVVGMPPAKVPTPSIRCASRFSRSALRRSVTSAKLPQIRKSSPRSTTPLTLALTSRV